MTMDQEARNKLIEQYLDASEAEFDRILEAGERKRRRRIIRWTALAGCAAAAGIALLVWLTPAHPSSDTLLSPVQIAEGIQQMNLLDIGDITSIEATPYASYAILTAHLKDGSTCSYILQFDDEAGTTTLLAYTDNE